MGLANLDWALVRSFLAMAREGSLAGASRRLGLAHPTLRRHLEALEGELGGALFTRSPAGLVATALGERLLEPAEAMEAAYGHLLRAASDPEGAAQGAVRVAASEVVGVEVLPDVFRRFRARHPRIEIELELSDEIADVLRREADVAVRMTRPRQEGLLARRVGTVELGLFVRGDLLGAEAPATLAEVARSVGLVGYDRRDDLITAFEARGVPSHRRDFVLRSDSTLAQLAAVRAGVAAGVCQVPLAGRDARLVRLLPEHSGRLEIWVATHPHLRTSAGVRALADALARGLRAYAAETPASPDRDAEPG